MEETIKSITEEVEKLLGLSNPINGKIEFNIKMIVQSSINYMNRKDFPKELELPIVKYIVDFNQGNSSTGAIKSVSEGDTKIEYVQVDPNALVLDLKSQLNRFRKVGTLC